MKYQARNVQLWDSVAGNGDNKITLFSPYKEFPPQMDGEPWIGQPRGDEMLIVRRLKVLYLPRLDHTVRGFHDSHVAVQVGLRTHSIGLASELQEWTECGLLVPARQLFVVTLAPLIGHPIFGEVSVFVDASLLQELP